MNAAGLAVLNLHPLLADIDPILLTSPGLGTEIMIQTAAGLVVFVVLLIVVRISLKRKKKRKRKRRHHRRHSRPDAEAIAPETAPASLSLANDPPVGNDAPEADEEAAEDDSADSHRHRRRRRMRRDHRPRFPSLAETGGLPPRRDNDDPTSQL